MNLIDALPDSYVFTSADYDAHWKLFARIMNEEDLTPEEQEFYDVTDDADRLSRIIKRQPTVGELKKWWNEDAKTKKS
jgi:hypothetical protein